MFFLLTRGVKMFEDTKKWKKKGEDTVEGALEQILQKRIHPVSVVHLAGVYFPIYHSCFLEKGAEEGVLLKYRLVDEFSLERYSFAHRPDDVLRKVHYQDNTLHRPTICVQEYDGRLLLLLYKKHSGSCLWKKPLCEKRF